MEALILSCGTGGGHNSAGVAVKEELARRGWGVTMLDPYSLVSADLAKKVGNVYIRVAQRTPKLFGLAYRLGELYTRLPVRSPVYFVNRRMVPVLSGYLREHPVDVVVCTHLFPGEILTAMKDQGLPVPKTVFVATDDACIPFTEECRFDYFCIPSAFLWGEFAGRGIPGEKLVVTGIPVKREFSNPVSREEAKDALGLSREKRYILLSGGSIGAGKVMSAVRTVVKFLNHYPDCCLIAVCGSNERLYHRLTRRFGKDSRVTVLKTTDRMALYMRSCDVFLSKPGGLSSAEAASMGVPLIHLPPIPGCETRNRRFFAQRKMSVGVNSPRQLLEALEFLHAGADTLIENQRCCCLPDGAESIALLCQMIASGKEQEA